MELPKSGMRGIGWLYAFSIPMKTVVSALFCLLAFSPALATEEGPADERVMWEARLKKVQVGMTRAEVEKLLPKYVAPPAPTPESGLLLIPYSMSATTKTGGSQSIRYYVSPGWCVSVSYDYAGVTVENSKGGGGYERPENKVLAPVILNYQVEPATKPVKVE